MKLSWFAIPALGVAFASSALAAGSFLSLEKALSFDVTPKVPIVKSENGTALTIEVAQRIDADSRIAMESIAKDDARKIVLETAFFSRGNNQILGSGNFWDGSAPRVLRIYLDAYGEDSEVLESFPLDVRTTGKSQELSIAAGDKATFTKFAFRFTIGGEPLELSSPTDNQLNVAMVSPDAMLFASDYGEVVSLLENLGMASKGSKEPIAVLEDVRRFRRSRGIEGPAFVSLGDLYALRTENDQTKGSIKILPYVLWASSVGGGRSIIRPAFTPKVEPASKSPVDEDVVLLEDPEGNMND